MNIHLENNYPHKLDLALQITIGYGYLTLNDFYRLINVDRFLKLLCINHIEHFYNLLIKCSQVPYVTNNIFRYWNVYEIPNDNLNILKIYKFDNSDTIFNKKLNNDEMAFYYSYFMFKFHDYLSFYKTSRYSKIWMCILNNKGFIKLIARDYIFKKENFGFNYKDDIFFKIELFYRYDIFKKKNEKLWTTKIKFINKGNEFIPNFVNLKLLDNLITNNTFYNMLHNKILQTNSFNQL